MADAEDQTIDAGGTKMARWTWSYALPGVGDLFYNYDRMKDYNNMHKDYVRNTGRTYKYPTQGYEAQKYRAMGQVVDKALDLGGKVVTAGRAGGKTGGTTKDVTKVDQTTLGRF